MVQIAEAAQDPTSGWLRGELLSSSLSELPGILQIALPSSVQTLVQGHAVSKEQSFLGPSSALGLLLTPEAEPQDPGICAFK